MKLIRIACLIALSAGVPVVHAQEAPARGPSGLRVIGRVIGAESSAPIADATIVVTGTTIVEHTNRNGEFAIVVPRGSPSFVVRRSGFLTAHIPIASDKTHYSIVLTTDILHLQTDVVNGLVTTLPSENAANAVSVMTASETPNPPPPALETLLEGHVPGAIVESSTRDAPGEGMQLEIRGATSIQQENQPLYVVDGVIVINHPGVAIGGTQEGNGINRIVDINPDDIANIELLKGASATAIYGAKAAAGAVIITTRKGSAANVHWDISGEVGHYSLANQIPMRRFPTLQSAQMWYVADAKQDTAASAISADNAFIQQVYAGPQNYQAQLFGNSQVSYLGSVSVEGTLGQTQYYLSASSKYDNGVTINTGDQRRSVRSNIAQGFGSILSVTANLDYATDVTRQGSFAGGAGNFAANAGRAPYAVMSYTPAFLNLDHQGANGTWATNPFGPSNPFADEMVISAPAKTTRFITGGTIAFTPWRTDHQSVMIEVVGGADHAALTDDVLVPPTLQSEQGMALPGVSITNTGHLTYTNISGSVIHHYAASWLDATTSFGYTTDREDNSNPVTVSQDLLTGVNASTTGTVETTFFEKTSALDHSFYGQEQILTLAARLALTAGVTAENSTLNGDIHHYYAYPHYAASYRVVQPVAVIGEIKFRAAYGESAELTPFGARFGPFTASLLSGTQGVYPGTSSAPVLKPETERETELGVDIAMFNARAQLSATVYQKRMSDLPLMVSGSPAVGYTSELINGGAFTDHGVELQLQATPVQVRNGLVWTATTTFARNYSVVDALPVAPFFVGANNGLNLDYFAVGRSATEIVNVNRAAANGLPVQVGDVLPGYQMSFGNTLAIRGVHIFGLADWSRGGSAYDFTTSIFDFGPYLSADSAQSAQRRAATLAGGAPYVESATYFTLRQITLSYDLPVQVINHVGFGKLSSARIALSGYNLWSTFSYKGPDAQAGEFGDATLPYPPARSYYLGLSLGI